MRELEKKQQQLLVRRLTADLWSFMYRFMLMFGLSELDSFILHSYVHLLCCLMALLRFWPANDPPSTGTSLRFSGGLTQSDWFVFGSTAIITGSNCGRLGLSLTKQSVLSLLLHFRFTGSLLPGRLIIFADSTLIFASSFACLTSSRRIVVLVVFCPCSFGFTRVLRF